MPININIDHEETSDPEPTNPWEESADEPMFPRPDIFNYVPGELGPDGRRVRSRSRARSRGRSTRMIPKLPGYPNLKQSIIDSGHIYVESTKDFLVDDVTVEEVDEIIRNAMMQPGSDGTSSSSSDDEYDRLHYRFQPEIEDDRPPRVLNPGPQTWWYDVALKSSGDDNSTLRNSIFHEIVVPGGEASTYRAMTLYRPQSDLHRSTHCVTKKVLSSRRSIRPDIKDDTIKLITASASPSGKSTRPEDVQFRWVHFQNPVLNLEEFKNQVLRIPDLEEHDLTILWDLFDRIKELKLERTYIHGKYMEEGAIRCDGKSSSESRAATFIAIPTLKLQSLETPSILKGQPKAFQSSDHAARPLMQTTINTASTVQEDKRQATLSSKLVPKDQAIHVVQTWILVINDDLLVTYSSFSLQELAGPQIEFEDGKQDDSVTILVRTSFQEAYYFAAEKCKTWFEFQTELKKVVQLPGYGTYKEKDAEIQSSDGTVLDSQNWAAQLDGNRLKLFRLTLEMKDNDPDTYAPPHDPYAPRSSSRRAAPHSIHSGPAYMNPYLGPGAPLIPYGPGGNSRFHHGRGYGPPPPGPPGYISGSGYTPAHPYGRSPSPPGYRAPLPSSVPHSRHVSRRSSHVEFEHDPSGGLVVGRRGSNRPSRGPVSIYPPIPPRAPHGYPQPSTSTGVTHTSYGQDPTSPYGHPPINSEYDYSFVPPPSFQRSYTMATDERDSKAVVRYGEHPNPAPPVPSPESRRRQTRASASSPEPRKTTVTDVVDEADAQAQYRMDSDNSDDPRSRRSRRGYPLALPAPPIPGDRERRPYATNTRDESERPSGARYREPATPAPPSVNLSLDESDTASDDVVEEKVAEEPQKLQTRRQTERRVAFAGESSDAPSSQPRTTPNADTPERPASAIPGRREEAMSPPARYGRPSNRTSRIATAKPQDPDSIFYYLPNERPAEKSKEKERSEEKEPAPELPKVLPVFQWPTKASVEADRIEKKRLTRKRASSRGSRGSNPLKKVSSTEVEASDESYSMLKNLLADLHQKLEKSKSKRVRASYLSCSSSDYIEVDNSLKEIKKTHLGSEDSPQKTKTLELIGEQEKIIEVSRNILCFFIPQNWKDGRLVECFWYCILQLVTIGFYESPQIERLFQRTLTKLESINRHIQVIITGVAGDDKENPRYRIPSALVEAFQNIVEAILLVLIRVEYLKEFLAMGPKQKPAKPPAATQLSVDKRFDACKSKLREGKFQLMCMIYTGRTKDQTNYEEACTEALVSFIIRNAICLPITSIEGASGPLAIYHEKLMNLDIEAKYRPQQKIIQDIAYLGEEVSAFDQVRKAQSRVLWAVDILLHPKGSLDMTDPRPRYSVTYSHPRNRMGGGIGHFLKEEQDGVDDQARRSAALHNSVVEALSVKEEDHGKAIMVFTIVTTVFLPLNFMTSFFGMNTTDIRDINRDQKIFWTTAIPVTVAVVGFALSWAYIGDSIQDRLFGPYSFWGKLFEGRVSKRRAKRGAKFTAEEEEEEEEDDDDEWEITDVPPPVPSYERTRVDSRYGYETKSEHESRTAGYQARQLAEMRRASQAREAAMQAARRAARYREASASNYHHQPAPSPTHPPPYINPRYYEDEDDEDERPRRSGLSRSHTRIVDPDDEDTPRYRHRSGVGGASYHHRSDNSRERSRSYSRGRRYS